MLNALYLFIVIRIVIMTRFIWVFWSSKPQPAKPAINHLEQLKLQAGLKLFFQ